MTHSKLQFVETRFPGFEFEQELNREYKIFLDALPDFKGIFECSQKDFSMFLNVFWNVLTGSLLSVFKCMELHLLLIFNLSILYVTCSARSEMSCLIPTILYILVRTLIRDLTWLRWRNQISCLALQLGAWPKTTDLFSVCLCQWKLAPW